MSLNKVIICGRLGSDPEVKQLTSGQTVAKLNIATSDKWTDANGNAKEKTEWHQVVVWGKQAELCGKYLYKGRQILVEGRLQTRSWEDKQGQKRYTTEIVANGVQFLGSKDAAPQNNNFGPEPAFDEHEEIPF